MMRDAKLFDDRGLLRRRASASPARGKASTSFALSHVADRIADSIGRDLARFPLALDIGVINADWQHVAALPYVERG